MRHHPWNTGYRWSSQDSKSSSGREHQAGLQQQHPAPVLLQTNSRRTTEEGVWPLNHWRCSRAQRWLRNSSRQPGEPQGWPSSAQLAHQGSASWNFPPSALIPDPLMWPAVVYLHCLWIHPNTVTKNSVLGGGNGPFLLYLGKKKSVAKIF